MESGAVATAAIANENVRRKGEVFATEQEHIELLEVADLLLDVAATLMGVGCHTSRVVRSVSRMAQSFGYEIFITVFQNNMTMMTRRVGQVETITLVRSTKHMGINFNIVSELSALSWHIHDDNLSVKEARAQYEAVMAKPRLSRWAVLILVSCANASFCRLFEGDWISCGFVFVATLIGFFIRQELVERKFNLPLTFVVCSFVASFIAGLAHILDWGTTPETAVATSVLFLIPGVPLINSLMDILEGHVLTGISRFVNASILIVSLSIGFFASLLILGLETL